MSDLPVQSPWRALEVFEGGYLWEADPKEYGPGVAWGPIDMNIHNSWRYLLARWNYGEILYMTSIGGNGAMTGSSHEGFGVDNEITRRIISHYFLVVLPKTVTEEGNR